MYQTYFFMHYDKVESSHIKIRLRVITTQDHSNFLTSAFKVAI